MQRVFKSLAEAPLTAKFGVTVVLVYTAVALLAPVLAPYGETEIVGDSYEVWVERMCLGPTILGATC